MYPNYGAVQQVQQPPERRSHVLDLISQLPSFRPNRDQSAFEGPLTLRDGRAISLRVTLPAGFPQAKPQLSLSHPLAHPWVDSSGQLSTPSLSRWGPQSRLSATVIEALQALSGQSTASPSTERHASPMDTSPSRAATAPTDFPELQTFPTEHLQELLTSKEAFQKLVGSYVDKSQPVHVKRLLIQGNLELAQANLARENEVGEIKNQIAIIRSSEYAAAKEAFDDAYTRQEAIMTKLKPHVLIEALAAKAAAADEAAETMHDDMMVGGTKVEAFVGPFTAKRKLFHQRELKQQAAQQIL